MSERRFVALEIVYEIKDLEQRDQIEEAILEIICDCQNNVGAECRMQYMAGTSGTLEECFKWLDPVFDQESEDEWKEWDFGDKEE